MAVEVKLPRLGQWMESGTIVRWLKSEGESVSKGEPLFELDTDKVTQEVEADADGVLLKIVVPEGEADVGTTVAVLGAEGEDVSELLAAAQSGNGGAAPAPATQAEAPVEEAPSDTVSQGAATAPEAAAPARAPGERVKASPLARRIAREREIDLAALSGTRERLVELLQEEETKPTVNDVLTRVVASALMRHRAVNAHFVEGRILRHPTANVGIAVATPNGLVVPVIRSAERKSVQEIAAVRGDLVSRARAGKLQLADLEEGTFTISNLGMYGIEQFIAVLNPPQVAILAVGSIEERPRAVGGELEIVPTLTMTLTCDHRAIDGSEGAEFLRTVKQYVETPALAL